MATWKRVGYAVVGMGDISQVAVLPAFRHSRKAKLIALVSGDREKAKRLARKFGASQHYTYDEYATCLENPEVEAVYIATPPGVHEANTVQAASAGKHVLCEKPLAATAEQARRMVAACAKNNVRFMTAYRKYFEPSSVALKKLVTRGDLGRIKLIHTLFTELRPPGGKAPVWLLNRTLAGGGPLMDLGPYCINTSRWVVGEDPVRATAWTWTDDPRRFHEVEESIGFHLDFPSHLVVQGTSSFGATIASLLHLDGEKGWAALTPAFTYDEERRLFGKIAGRPFQKLFKVIDEFAPELDHFATCVRENRNPEPDGQQGLRDMIIIEAIYRSAREGRSVAIEYS